MSPYNLTIGGEQVSNKERLGPQKSRIYPVEGDEAVKVVRIERPNEKGETYEVIHTNQTGEEAIQRVMISKQQRKASFMIDEIEIKAKFVK